MPLLSRNGETLKGACTSDMIIVMMGFVVRCSSTIVLGPFLFYLLLISFQMIYSSYIHLLSDMILSELFAL